MSVNTFMPYTFAKITVRPCSLLVLLLHQQNMHVVSDSKAGIVVVSPSLSPGPPVNCKDLPKASRG